MRMDKLTSKFQMALADAQSLALGRDHNYIEPVHVTASADCGIQMVDGIRGTDPTLACVADRYFDRAILEFH